MIVEFISVGTEILLGDIVNTNVQYLSQVCARLGLDVFHSSVVGDNHDRLMDALRLATSRSDCIILTGGLGSTDDDITKRVVIEFLGNETEESDYNRQVVNNWFADDKAKEDNRIVYTFPKGSTILENHVGTASGAWVPFEIDGHECFIVILPGPPNEMQPMVDESLVPLLTEHSEGVTKSLVIRMGVIGEYQMNEVLKDEIAHSVNPTFAPYVKDDGALLRITAKSSNLMEADRMISSAMQIVKEKLGHYIVAVGEESRPEVLVRLLREKGEKIATAESLTAGLVAATIVDAAGASDVFEQSFVVYSDRAKHKILTVPKKKLKESTAVSETVCKAMLNGLYARTGAELCIATTGYAGPDGDDVGHVFIGIAYHGKNTVHEHHFHGSRGQIRNRVKNVAIDYAIMTLKRG